MCNKVGILGFADWLVLCAVEVQAVVELFGVQAFDRIGICAGGFENECFLAVIESS
jgi:hypothetical protein